MARIRSVKPEFWTDEKIVELSFPARLFFIGLFNFADDEGRLTYSPRRLKLQIFPADNIKIEKLSAELLRLSLITIYKIEDIEFIQINNFKKHQKIDKRSKSNIPSPESLRIPPNPSGNSLGREGIKEGIKDQGGDQVETKNAPKGRLTDEEFLKTLEGNPAYKHIDLQAELAKMDAWLLIPKNRRRQKTPGFIVNWLNRIERPIAPSTSFQSSTAPPRPKILDEPEPDPETREENAVKAKELVKNLTQKMAGA